jgi:hypothetical protein
MMEDAFSSSSIRDRNINTNLTNNGDNYASSFQLTSDYDMDNYFDINKCSEWVIKNNYKQV